MASEPVERTCKTCRWWAKSTEHRHNEDKGGWCQSPKLGQGKFSPASDDELDQLIYEYDEGGHFWTGPDFGCVHREPKVDDRGVLRLPDSMGAKHG